MCYWSCICLRGIDFASVSTIFLLEFGTIWILFDFILCLKTNPFQKKNALHYYVKQVWRHQRGHKKP